MRYEVLEHTADLMVKAYGRTLKECFENAAYAMMDQIVDASSARLTEEVGIAVEGADLEELLYNFLSEVLFIFDARGSSWANSRSISGTTAWSAGPGANRTTPRDTPPRARSRPSRTTSCR